MIVITTTRYVLVRDRPGFVTQSNVSWRSSRDLQIACQILAGVVGRAIIHMSQPLRRHSHPDELRHAVCTRGLLMRNLTALVTLFGVGLSAGCAGSSHDAAAATTTATVALSNVAPEPSAQDPGDALPPPATTEPTEPLAAAIAPTTSPQTAPTTTVSAQTRSAPAFTSETQPYDSGTERAADYFPDDLAPYSAPAPAHGRAPANPPPAVSGRRRSRGAWGASGSAPRAWARGFA